MTLRHEIDTIPTGWKKIIQGFILNHPNEWRKIEELYNNSNTVIYPPKEFIFRCFHYFEPNETRVVLMGQDPYHGEHQATGLCFAINTDHITKIPPSLRNIGKEFNSDLGYSLSSYNLEQWAKQGILMINASLTVEHKKPSSHMKQWLPFTEYIMKYLSNNYDNLVYLVWGAFAHKQVKDIVDIDKNHIIISSHPSPLSAYKQYGSYCSFIGSRPFTKVNRLIERKIHW